MTMDEQDAPSDVQSAEVQSTDAVAALAQRPPAIDIEALADRVYALMLDDLRLAGMRGALQPEERWNR